jgi:hypothetical protein
MSPSATNWCLPPNRDWVWLWRQDQYVDRVSTTGRKAAPQEGVDRRQATQDNCGGRVWEEGAKSRVSLARPAFGAFHLYNVSRIRTRASKTKSVYFAAAGQR